LRADISLNIARAALNQPPKLPQFCLDYDSGILKCPDVLKNDVKRKKRDGFWFKILELSDELRGYLMGLMEATSTNILPIPLRYPCRFLRAHWSEIMRAW